MSKEDTNNIEWEKRFENLKIASVILRDRDDDTYVYDESPEFLKDFIKSLLSLALKEQRERIVERAKKVIICKKCNGQGARLGAGLGVSECEDCGGDGHCLYNREGEKLEDILSIVNKQ